MIEITSLKCFRSVKNLDNYKTRSSTSFFKIDFALLAHSQFYASFKLRLSEYEHFGRFLFCIFIWNCIEPSRQFENSYLYNIKSFPISIGSSFFLNIVFVFMFNITFLRLTHMHLIKLLYN